jgi:hypothetical protein
MSEDSADFDRQIQKKNRDKRAIRADMTPPGECWP